MKLSDIGVSDGGGYSNANIKFTISHFSDVIRLSLLLGMLICMFSMSIQLDLIFLAVCVTIIIAILMLRMSSIVREKCVCRNAINSVGKKEYFLLKKYDIDLLNSLSEQKNAVNHFIELCDTKCVAFSAALKNTNINFTHMASDNLSILKNNIANLIVAVDKLKPVIEKNNNDFYLPLTGDDLQKFIDVARLFETISSLGKFEKFSFEKNV